VRHHGGSVDDMSLSESVDRDSTPSRADQVSDLLFTQPSLSLRGEEHPADHLRPSKHRGQEARRTPESLTGVRKPSLKVHSLLSKGQQSESSLLLNAG
jgi:hypothetical protein